MDKERRLSSSPLVGDGERFSAAETSLKRTLPMTDTIVYATAAKEACLVETPALHSKGYIRQVVGHQ